MYEMMDQLASGQRREELLREAGGVWWRVLYWQIASDTLICRWHGNWRGTPAGF
jgi:hypothetical protein